jgi:energy-coupling factor transporter ATP-binding protein EcfA2
MQRMQDGINIDKWRTLNTKLFDGYIKTYQKLASNHNLDAAEVLVSEFGGLNIRGALTVDGYGSAYIVAREIGVYYKHDDQYKLSNTAQLYIDNEITYSDYLKHYCLNIQFIIDDKVVHPFKEIVDALSNSSLNKKEISEKTGTLIPTSATASTIDCLRLFLDRCVQAELLIKENTAYKLNSDYQLLEKSISYENYTNDDFIYLFIGGEDVKQENIVTMLIDKKIPKYFYSNSVNVGLQLEGFIEWFIARDESHNNYFKNVFSSSKEKLTTSLIEYEKMYAKQFKKNVFSVDLEDIEPFIFKLDNNLNEDKGEFIDYSKSKSNHTPRAILGKQNYIKYLRECVMKSENKFSWSDFDSDIEKSGLSFDSQLIQRFVASLQTKQFVILTGLAGSGKTKLAEAFSSWITNDLGMQQVFTKDQELLAKKATYIVRDISNTNITVESEGKSMAVVPFEFVEFWADIIINNNFDIDTPSQTIQGKVREKFEDEMTYSTSHNSFHSILKSLALESVTSRNKANFKSNPKKQVCMVAVGADWTNREPLLGYPNALNEGKYVRPESGVLDVILAAQDDSKNPYFLILDEMNMSHVERYFADFLSAMESVNSTISLHSGDKEWSGVPSKVTLPKNLFIIGTVNVDETTYMFSPKVLDRANVIEFTVSKEQMNEYLRDSSISLDMKGLNGKGAHMAQNFVDAALSKISETEKAEGLNDKLMPFFNDLQKVGAEFGYRTASEVSRFISIYDSMNGVIDDNGAIDAAIVQKLLPKLHGSRNKLQGILVILAKQCLHKASREDAFNGVSEDDIKYPISHAKLKRMHKRIMADGFTSFAEA